MYKSEADKGFVIPDPLTAIFPDLLVCSGRIASRSASSDDVGVSKRERRVVLGMKLETLEHPKQ